MGIFCLAELYVHVNDYGIESDALVIRSDLFYSFALGHTFEVFLLFLPNFIGPVWYHSCCLNIILSLFHNALINVYANAFGLQRKS